MASKIIGDKQCAADSSGSPPRLAEKHSRATHSRCAYISPIGLSQARRPGTPWSQGTANPGSPPTRPDHQTMPRIIRGQPYGLRRTSPQPTARLETRARRAGIDKARKLPCSSTLGLVMVFAFLPGEQEKLSKPAPSWLMPWSGSGAGLEIMLGKRAESMRRRVAKACADQRWVPYREKIPEPSGRRTRGLCALRRECALLQSHVFSLAAPRHPRPLPRAPRPPRPPRRRRHPA